LTGFDEELSFLNFVGVFKEAALWRTGGASAILVIDAAVARTHEEAGLRKPANGTAEMHAIDGKDLKGVIVDAADPAVTVGGFTVQWLNVGIAECAKTRLACGK